MKQITTKGWLARDKDNERIISTKVYFRKPKMESGFYEQ